MADDDALRCEWEFWTEGGSAHGDEYIFPNFGCWFIAVASVVVGRYYFLRTLALSKEVSDCRWTQIIEYLTLGGLATIDEKNDSTFGGVDLFRCWRDLIASA